MVTSEKPVGVVGLGSMGGGMARSLLRAGFAVHGFDVDKRAMSALAEHGLVAASSPAEVAKAAEVVILSVVNADQTATAIFGENGIADSLVSGGVIIATSTVPPDFIVHLEARVRKAGFFLIDAPVSGGVSGALEGKLSVMGAGPPAAFDRADAVLGAIAANVYRLSQRVGDGSRMKMINQLLAGVHIVAACEAMALASRAGIDLQSVYDIISKSAGFSWMFGDRVPHILAGDYSPKSAVDIFVKDLGIVLDTGRALDFPLPLTSAAHQLFLAAKALGHGKADDSSVVKVYQELSGIALP